jgi:hypothetical protein
MPKIQSLTPDFLEEEVNIRGVIYHLRELSIGEYDELVTKATKKITNPITGEDVETIDNAVLLKMMVLRCSFDPKINAEMLSGFPMRVVLKLNQTVNRMHYGDEPEGKKIEKPEADEAEETPKGNA